MARAVPTPVARTGFVLAPNLTAAVADGDIVDVGTRLWVLNGSGASINVTAVVTTEVSGLEVEDLIEPVPAGAARLIGPFSNLFKQPADAVEGAGKVLINYSAVASVTRGVVMP